MTCHFAFSRHIKPLLFVAVASRGCDRSPDSWLEGTTAAQNLFLLCLFRFSHMSLYDFFDFSLFFVVVTDVHYMRLIFTNVTDVSVFFFSFFLFFRFLTDHREKHED